ncbi:MAG: hypothetical protein VX278_11435 [Myxococcota bacterium]|nr:hypothetical protein [Myxococcota bacterium]
MIYILLSSTLCAWAESSQNLTYDLSVNGVAVGERRVDVTYLPSSKSNPLGMRRVELWTTANMNIQGQEVSYTQRGTAQFSDQRASFVISTKINEQITEIQGKKAKNGNWIVHQISNTALKKTEYRRGEVSAISLELFDPGQVDFWQPQDSYQLLVLEGLDPFIIQGVWSEEKGNLSAEIQSLAAKQLQGKSKEGVLNAVWSDAGMLIDWDVAIMGVELNANIRSVPPAPNFGEIVSPQKLTGIEEQEL